MENTTRRKFCGTAVLALPGLALIAKADTANNGGFFDSPDAIFNSLADEFAGITVDGARNGFKAEHFRRYAGFMRVFDAHMEIKGINKETDKRLDEDDFHKLNPFRSARSVSDFWRKRNIIIREDELIDLLTMDWRIYKEWKKAIKKQGGIRALHARVAVAFEQKAKEYEASVLRHGPFMRQGRIEFPRQEEKDGFMKAAYDQTDRLITEFVLETSILSVPLAGDIYEVAKFVAMGINYDCLCRAMVVEGAALSLACLTGWCAPCCAPAAMLLATEKLIESFKLCSPSQC